MKRRDLIGGVFSGVAFGLGNAFLWKMAQESAPSQFGDSALTAVKSKAEEVTVVNEEVANALEKVRFFENEFVDDVYLPQQEFSTLAAALQRLERVQKFVGHGNFNLLGFDDMLSFARNYDSIGEFTKTELDFMEKIFFTEANVYGFFGEKVESNLTATIRQRDVHRVPYTGHYVFKGAPEHYYAKLTKDVGPQIVLTSGIRSVVKQMHLFLAKCAKSNGNLSKASRSLAPPGHSYHGIGDFDVGRLGWGADNFTAKFALTDEFKKMQDLGYVQIRYTEDNHFGVRFEPWHIKVV